MKKTRLVLIKSKHSELATRLEEEGLYKEGMEVQFDENELAMGVKVEMEHTTDPAVAEQIAMDHLVEDDTYYSKLKEIEKSIKDDIQEFLKENPNPDDDQVHAWAEANGHETDDVEEIFYQLATEAVEKGCDGTKKLLKGDDDDDEDEEDISERDAEVEAEQRNEEVKDQNEEAKVQKSSLIFKSSNKYTRKYMKDGKWVYIYKPLSSTSARSGEKEKRAETMKEFKKYNNERAQLYKPDNKPDFKNMIDSELVKEYFEASGDLDRFAQLKNMKGSAMLINLAANRMDRISGMLDRRGNTSAISDASRTGEFEKAKPYPDGTIRKHGGRTMVKKDGGWVPAEAGEASQTPEAKEEAGKTSRNTKKKGSTPTNTLEGSPAMLTALVRIGGNKGPFLDDLNGKDRALYNGMTKAGLIRWVHLAEEEYRPELTDAGSKALANGQALKQKNTRAKKATKKKKK